MTREEHRGKCPRCSSEMRTPIRIWNETGYNQMSFDWDTYSCDNCGLRYDE